MALEPLGAFAELVRYEGIRGNARADEYRRRLWVMFVRETDIADLSTFDAYDACGLDPRLAVGEHTESQKLANELRAAGFRGVLSPSAALVGATNLTLFGARYEKVLLGGLATWPNPQPGLRVPCSLVVGQPARPAGHRNRVRGHRARRLPRLARRQRQAAARGPAVAARQARGRSSA